MDYHVDRALQMVEQLGETLALARKELSDSIDANGNLADETAVLEATVTDKVLNVVKILDPDSPIDAPNLAGALERLRVLATKVVRELQATRDLETVVARTAPWSAMLTELYLQAPEFAGQISRRLANRLGYHCPQCWVRKGWAHGDLAVISDRDMGEDGLS